MSTCISEFRFLFLQVNSRSSTVMFSDSYVKCWKIDSLMPTVDHGWLILQGNSCFILFYINSSVQSHSYLLCSNFIQIYRYVYICNDLKMVFWQSSFKQGLRVYPSQLCYPELKSFFSPELSCFVINLSSAIGSYLTLFCNRFIIYGWCIITLLVFAVCTCYVNDEFLEKAGVLHYPWFRWNTY